MNNMSLNVINRIIISGKTIKSISNKNNNSEENNKIGKKYWFYVKKDSNKKSIKESFENYFRVKIQQIRTLNSKKTKYRSRTKNLPPRKYFLKKAIVKLFPGKDLGLFTNND